MKIFAFSDPHAHLVALEDTLRRVDLSGENKLILLGDYIDYGEQSGQVLQRIFDLQRLLQQYNIPHLRGDSYGVRAELSEIYHLPLPPFLFVDTVADYESGFLGTVQETGIAV